MSEIKAETGPWRLRFTAVMVLGVLGVFTGTLLSLLGRFWWFADLASHFAVYYTLAGAGLFLLALGLRRWVMSGLALFIFVVNGLLIWPTFMPVTTHVPPGSSVLTIAQVNILHMNRNKTAVADFLNDCEADLVIIQEADAWWDRTLREVGLPYIIAESQPREGSFGMSLLVHKSLAEGDAIVLQDTHVMDLADGFTGDERPAIEATLSLHGQTIRILSIHPPPPVSHRYTALRDSVLRQAKRWSDQQTVPHIVIGDLNTTPWSYAFSILTENDGLVSTQDGFGNHGTWPSRIPLPIYLPIDHCLISPQWVCIDRYVGGYIGSDHWPLLVTLALPSVSESPAAVEPGNDLAQLPADTP